MRRGGIGWRVEGRGMLVSGLTGSWAKMELNCAGFSTPESRRYSSSVRMVERERLMPALSPIVQWRGRVFV